MSHALIDALRAHHVAPSGSAPGEGGPVLVVSHGGVIRLWLTEVRGEMAPPISNTAVYTVEHDGLGVPRAGLLSDLGGDPENRSESS